MPGVLGWDPLHADRSNAPGWVLVPAIHALRWNRLALEALRCAREASERRISYGEVPAPPPAPQSPAEAVPVPASNPASLAQRVSAAIASGFRSFTLSPVERAPQDHSVNPSTE